jgi:hypothetical protein
MNTDCKYILDTQAIRSLGAAKLREAQAKARLFVSPLTVYEILCHLDETGDFHKFRQTILKCSIPTMLPDPWAHHALTVGAPHKANPTHFEEERVCRELLAALSASATLDDFFACRIRFSDGVERTFRESPAHARSVLAKEEADYVAHCIKLREKLLEGETKQQVASTDDAGLAADAFESVKELRKDYLDSDIPPERLAVLVTNSMFVHYGYKLARIYEHIRSQNALDGNDAEDSLICVYVDVLEPTVLVTGDDGTYAAVTRSINGFNAYFVRRAARALPNVPHHEKQVRAYNIYDNEPTGSPDGDWFKAEDELRALLAPRAECRVIKPDAFLKELGLERG